MAGSGPLISIVTSSFNQAPFIARTIESVIAQDYPAVEHIVVDGMSSDGTAAVLDRYPHLKVIREPDRGQADAINKGFRAATGQILCFLNSDDTLEPGALRAVAEAIDPAQGRHVVMGRCRFIDEADRFLGVEHPSGFESHRRVLEIWKGHLLPQPAIFWTREVWDACGPLNVDERLMLDYDLFCRFSRRYRFWYLDRILANYRLHNESKTNSMTDAQRLEQAITVSRRYWGSPLRPQYWRILASYAAFRMNRRGRAVRLMRAGQAAFAAGHRLQGASRAAAGAVLAPDVVTDVLVVPAIRPVLGKIWRAAAGRRRDVSPQTNAWLGLTTLYDDGWAGPTLILNVDVPATHSVFEMSGVTMSSRLREPLVLEAFANGRSLGTRTIADVDEFSVRWDLLQASAGRCQLRIAANTFVVSDDCFGNQDFRPLSYRPSALRIESDGMITEIHARE
jgi:glycosyltransferase involved in cell wall biosynthesis